MTGRLTGRPFLSSDSEADPDEKAPRQAQSYRARSAQPQVSRPHPKKEEMNVFGWFKKTPTVPPITDALYAVKLAGLP
jgi:hypothetical protein